MVSYRVKKKLADRICQYCEKEFRYPYLFLRHKLTKCWTNGESTSGQSRVNEEFTLDNVESTMSLQQVNVKSTMSLQPDNVESRISSQPVNVGSKIKLD
ncbi:hypothetical protein RclHR1_02150017 [Rhizophagus clarus]|uniref:Uncharacterized protein n=1 Tax=Rhizophagus clarus TaxID=94130 RepID=A0A2Z6QTI9_9GLOM|nr:hypothetical protein RclHR1_02150017 [Rhizophagus clarus]GES93806.1 hypothetical protein RCL_e8452_RclHR1_02150017 [Rhizophagus clarus]